jgi:hypothetical protein
MHFDDRLATVMRLPASSQAMARIQYRQLLDLLGGDEHAELSASEPALARIVELGALIPAPERAALLKEPAFRIASPALVARLATLEPEVASAAITAADLSEAQWIALIPSLPVQARGILRHRRGFGPKVEALLERLGIGDRGLPPVANTSRQSQRPELVVVEGGGGTIPRRRVREEPSAAGIGAIVRRIEAFRTARSDAEEAGDFGVGGASSSRSAKAQTAVLALDFTTDADGRLDWADGVLASSVIGFRLAGIIGEVHQAALRDRLPLRGLDVLIPGAPSLAGAWRLDALPSFVGPDGRFAGYAGRLRRLPVSAPSARAEPSTTADSMREVLHELRTPANAIQVAAEIIQQQLYGPAPHEYRALAAAIAGDTAQILAGFDELDRLVRLESGALRLAIGTCELGTLVFETVERLQAWTAARGSGFRMADRPPALMVGLDADEVARLLWRLLAAFAGMAQDGETIDLAFSRSASRITLFIETSPALGERLKDAMTAGRPFELARSLSAGMFGVGFTLRLAAAEAAAAGGMLTRVGERFALTLPGLTTAAAGHTQG